MQLKWNIESETDLISRRVLLRRAGGLGSLAVMQQLLPVCAKLPRVLQLRLDTF